MGILHQVKAFSRESASLEDVDVGSGKTTSTHRRTSLFSILLADVSFGSQAKEGLFHAEAFARNPFLQRVPPKECPLECLSTTFIIPIYAEHSWIRFPGLALHPNE